MKLFYTLISLLGFTYGFGQERGATPKMGQEQFVKKINSELKLTDAEMQKDIAGEVILDFRINENGKIDSIDVVRDLGDGIALRLIDILKRSGDWAPAQKGGAIVASWVRFPYRVLSFKDSESSSVTKKADPVEGMEVFMEKLYNNFQYPPEAIKAGISGDYEINFVVKEDGKITSVKLKNDPGYGILTSVQRALNKSGRWKPASQNGRAVRSSVVIPLKLNLKQFRTHI
ncbi:hypothetical protein BWD42_22025 [Sphingobacterium sp. CZ-UAM]|uniref:energy transducer TonB n=1 Tax=Sphingobacterium sp. CZ-UAM TaxID=1933868 RepID=UPI000985B6DE|nr:energy transducer TonB [Sphingobacterium sp. CZ-UAM]OOG16065.1 hypothetical protein BWD42_22025 [Sphingobacterium sp. CZ-UAM]